MNTCLEQVGGGTDCIVLIPAYNPDAALCVLVHSLSKTRAFARIVIVNDGSQPHCQAVFESVARHPGVTVLHHAINLGKGAALKTGLNHICCHHSRAIGVVTADADGQHLVEDIVRVAEALAVNPHDLAIGVRRFDGEVPFRSWLGNRLTKLVFRMLVGMTITDTQTGLRGIPLDFATTLLRLKSSEYEFELDMLIQSKFRNVAVRECEIETIYLDGNKSSHFDPLWDSLKIYFVFFRFIVASLMTTACAMIMFFGVWAASDNVLASEISSRALGILINFLLVKETVFHSRKKLVPTFAKYLTLVFVLGLVSYLMILGMMQFGNLGILTAKVATALLLYLANFAVQRDFVFGVHELASSNTTNKAAIVDTVSTPLAPVLPMKRFATQEALGSDEVKKEAA